MTMRLLNVHTRRLQQFLGSTIPKYAILSHTWGPDEARYEDYCGDQAPQWQTSNSKTSQRRSTRVLRHAARWRRAPQQPLVEELARRRRLRGPGHEKIDACCRQAQANGYDYVWIDTCCIDKKSSSELSEAINSMFSWYSKAAICYVFLKDVRPSSSAVQASSSITTINTPPAQCDSMQTIPSTSDDHGAGSRRTCSFARPGQPRPHQKRVYQDPWQWMSLAEPPISEDVQKKFDRAAAEVWNEDFGHLLSPQQLHDIEHSRWFQRGWTLQELLAPSCLAFFDSGWNMIGFSCRSSFEQSHMLTGMYRQWTVPRLTGLLAKISGVSRSVLWSGLIGSTSVAERMSWASKRRTTREEDIAYCLLGIFGVAMPLLYGEGTNAFRRLLIEIIRASADQSVLAFGLSDFQQDAHVRRPSTEDLGRGDPGASRGVACLARSPADFGREGFKAIIGRKQSQAGHYYFTNQGLSIEQRLAQLPSGEMLMRLGCSIEGGQGIVDEEKMCLALILRPSRGLNNGYMRRRDNALTLVNSRYFRSPGMFLDLNRRVYLYHADNESHGRRGFLITSESFREAFRIRTTYPTFADPATGALHRILLGPSGWQYGRIADIYIDCAASTGRQFALRVFIFGGPATKKDGSHILPNKPWRACLYICRSRAKYSMVELMLNAPELMPQYQKVEFSDPGIEWKPCMSVAGYEVFLRHNANDENAVDKRGWTLDAKPRADKVMLTLKESLAVRRITSWPIVLAQ